MTLEEIIEKLTATDKPDPRIDAFLTCMFHLKGLRPAEPDDFDGKFGYRPSNIKTEHGFLMAHPYTADLNEAVGLMEKILPGASWHLGKGYVQPSGPLYGAAITEVKDNETILGDAESHHAALALTLATLRAYAGMGKKPELFSITRKDGGEPCGECHIQPSEICDICGAIGKVAQQ